MSELEVQKKRWLKVLDVLGKEAENFCAVGGGAIWQADVHLGLEILRDLHDLSTTDGHADRGQLG